MKLKIYLSLLGIFLFLSCTAVSELSRKEVVEGPQFSPYHGLKRRIAVLDFDNHTPNGGKKFGSAVSDMLISLLVRSGRFTIIERQQVEKVFNEQALGQSGTITEETAARVGELLGVQAIIIGDILEAEQKTGSHTFSNKEDDDKKNKDEEKKDKEKKDDFWQFALKTTVGHVKLHYRMIDTNTGEVLFSNQSKGTEIKPGFGLVTKDFDFSDMFEIDQTVLGFALRKAVNQMATDIVNSTPAIDWTGKVVKVVSDSLLYFTPGTRSGVKLEQNYNIYKEQVVEEDPVIIELIPNGKVKVYGFIGDKITKARILKGINIKRGDVVKKSDDL